MAYTRQGHHRAQGPRARPRTPRHVHRIDRPDRPPPPRLRGRRQLGRRGDGRRGDPHRRHPARRRRVPRRRQRSRHPGRQPPRVPGQVGRRGRHDHAARGRQVRRRRLQDLRRSPRRRRLGGERAVEPPRARDPPRRRQVGAALREGRRARRARSSASRRSKKRGTTVTFWPDATIFEETEFRAQTLDRAAARDGVPQQGPRDPLPRRAHRPGHRAGLQVQRRHRRLREAPQRVEGAAVQAGRRRSRSRRPTSEVDDRDAVEHRLLRGHPLVREQHRHHRGRDARGGLQEGPHQRGQQVRQGQEPPQGQGRQPPRRGHPRGPHRDRLGEAAQPAVRGSDQGQARQHRDALDGREGHEREARPTGSRSTRRRAGQIVQKATQAAARPRRGRARRATSPGASRCSSRRRCRASSPTARRRTRASASCSSSRATAPAAAPSARAIPRTRRSCRSAGRSSTSSAPASTRC